MLVALAAGCGGDDPITGPLTGAGGRVTFTPLDGVTVRGAAIRAQAFAPPHDNRAIPGTAFWFDLGLVSRPDINPAPNHAGTLTVSYAGLALPEGTVESRLYLAWWDSRSWLRVEGSTVSPTDKLVSAPIPEDFGARQYAIIGNTGLYVRIEDSPIALVGGDSLHVTAWTASDADVSSVVASVEGRSVSLEGTPSRSGPYTGALPLTGLPSGEYILRVSAARTDGLALTDTAKVTKNLRPRVTVHTPAPGDTVGQTFRLHVTCTDDDPRGCRALEAVAYGSGSTFIVLASGSSSIDRDVSLGGITGPVRLYISAQDHREHYDTSVSFIVVAR